jgi:hypothetical protein
MTSEWKTKPRKGKGTARDTEMAPADTAPAPADPQPTAMDTTAAAPAVDPPQVATAAVPQSEPVAPKADEPFVGMIDEETAADLAAAAKPAPARDPTPPSQPQRPAGAARVRAAVSSPSRPAMLPSRRRVAPPPPPAPKRVQMDDDDEETEELDDPDVPKYADILAPILGVSQPHGSRSNITLGIC